jgi:bifunctional non-homologous end joining protein LigD
MAGLQTYHAKRDFRLTQEPKGKIARGKGKYRFVIQRHAAIRLHYDLRLEMDGVYKSWAVTRTPSLDPSVKRLAVEVEDHPIEYGTFEGTIPKGEYGGGTVQLWDRGTWAPQGDDPEAEIKKGQLKIVMNGERMKGKWAFIRLRDEEPKAGRKLRHNWLLIKEIDDFAQRGDAGDALAKEVTSVVSGLTLDEIAAKSTKVWHSNRSVDENVKALKKAPAAKAAKKKTRKTSRH